MQPPRQLCLHFLHSNDQAVTKSPNMDTIEVCIATRCSYPDLWTVERDDQIAGPHQDVGDILNLGCLTHRHKELLGTLPPTPMARPRNFRGTE